MAKKQRVEKLPQIQVLRHREEHVLCRTPGCRNVIARWLNRAYCVKCQDDTR